MDEDTEPGFKARTDKLREKIAAANAKADPNTDRLLGRIQDSEWSAVIFVVILLASFGVGVWVAW